jgi:hypothetical protein
LRPKADDCPIDRSLTALAAGLFAPIHKTGNHSLKSGPILF